MSLYKNASLAMIPTAYKDGRLYSVRPVPEYGAELVTNGDFSGGSTGWTAASGWSIASGKATASATNNNLQTSTSIVTGGTNYIVSFEISNYSSGTLNVDLGTSTYNGQYTSNGLKSIVLTAGGFNKLRFYGGSISCDIDNVSVKEVLTASGDFDFSRGSNLAATRVASSGYIEKGRENLLLQSNAFDTTWVSSNTTETGGQSGYDGTSDAWLLTKSAAYANLNQSVSASGVNTYSLYAKANTLTWLRIVGGSTSAFFDLSNGVVGTTDAGNIAKMTSIGSGWYRCEVAMNASTTIMRIYPAQADNDVTGTSGNIYIQDAQLEQGLVATDYIETGATTAKAGILEDMPRLDYSGSATCPSLLLEPQRTNELAQSEYILFNFKDTGATIEYNQATSPEGLNNACRLNGQNADRFDRYQSFNGSALTMSIFAKAGDCDEFRLLHDGASITSQYADFNLTTGVVSGSSGNLLTGSGIENYGNGWYRCHMSISASATSGAFERVQLLATGDMYVYGWQQEYGSYPTSYIPTFGSAVTRNQEDCNKTGVSDLIGQTEGTLFFEFEDAGYSDTSIARGLAISDGTYNNRLYISQLTTGAIYAVGVTSGVANLELQESTPSSRSKVKAAVAYKNNDCVLYVNGTQAATDTSASIPSTSRIDLGQSAGGGAKLYKPYNSVILFKTRLTNTELASLTTL